MRRSLAAFAASVLALAGLSACGTPDYYIVTVTGTADAPASITVTANGIQHFSSTDVSLPFAFQVKGEDATSSLRVQASVPDPKATLSCDINSVKGENDTDVDEASGTLLVSARVEVACES